MAERSQPAAIAGGAEASAVRLRHHTRGPQRAPRGPLRQPTYTMSPSAAMPNSCCVPQTPHTFIACHITLRESCCDLLAGVTVTLL